MAENKLISSLNKFISKKMDDKASNFRVFETFGKVTEYISFGNYMLNAQISGSLFGGLPNTRALELAGASGTGKTFLCLNLVHNMIDKGYHVYYIDTEGALDEDLFANFGIDYEAGVTHLRTINTFSGVIEFINVLVSGIRDARANANSEDDVPKVAIILDSLGMLNTDASLENAEKGKYAEDMGKRAKIIREFFRTITLKISNYAIPFVYTNHTSVNLDMFAIDKEVTAGGEGATYSAGMILMLQKTNYMKDDAKTRTGIILRSRPKKNRSVQPRDIEFHLSFVHGMNPYVGLEKYLSWDNCGVDPGTVLSAEEYNKKYSKKPPTNSKGEALRVESWKDKSGEWYAILNPNARTLAIKDTHNTVNQSEVFTSNVFTEGTLRQLDENIIKQLFQYSSKSNDTAEQIAEMINDSIVEEK